MAWINVISEKEAEGELAECYEEIRSTRGRIANVLMCQSLNPRSLLDHLNLYLTLMYRRSSLSRGEREMIAVAVSSANNCKYCTTHHSEALGFVTKDPVVGKQVAADHRKAELEDKTKAMLDYAIKLTRSPSSVSEQDVKDLRDHGFSDEDILNINLVTSYFNFVNRVVEGLGVELEEDPKRNYKY